MCNNLFRMMEPGLVPWIDRITDFNPHLSSKPDTPSPLDTDPQFYCRLNPNCCLA